MKKLSNITESIWSDIQDRSSGITVRKEDNVNNMDLESFWLYIIKNYKERVRTLDKDHYRKEYDMDIVVDPTKDIVIFGSYVKDELVRIMVVLKTKVKDTTVKKIIDASPDNFRWIRLYSDKLELELNDGEVTNQTFVDLIEFFLNNQQVFESIWSDIQDRSSGETVRKEDDVNNLNRDDMYEYLKTHYKATNRFRDISNVDSENYISVPTFAPFGSPYCLYYEFNKNEVRMVSTLKDTMIFTSMKNDYSIGLSEDEDWCIICPKDGSEVNNTFFISVLDYIINYYSGDPYKLWIRKILSTNESIWSDIQDRSSGDVVRDEDKFNPDYTDFGPNTTVYWVIDNLEIDGKVKFYFDDVKDYNNNGWRLPTIDEVNQLKWNIRISWYDECRHLEFDSGNELKLKTHGSGGFHMWTKEINPKFPSGAYAYGFDNSYNFDISNFNKSINKLFVFLVKDKKITESIWSDIQDRSSGETIRKEDEVGNLHELKPVDMGGSVLWADKNLICDGDELFTFHEAYELIKNSTWRLPTRKEVAELDGHNIYYDTQYIYLDDDKKLSFKKCGVKYIPKIGNPFTLDESKAFYGWTSEVTKYNSNDIHVFFLNHFELAYSPENERAFNQVTQNADSKCCIRLVKNK